MGIPGTNVRNPHCMKFNGDSVQWGFRPVGIPSSGYVIDAWTELKAVIWTCCPTQAMSKYITYFEENWIFSSSCPPSLWNCCAATLDGDPRTNNASERGNNTQTRNNFEQSLHLVLRANYPGIKFLDGAEASPHLAEHDPERPQRPRWRFREETIKRLVETYN